MLIFLYQSSSKVIGYKMLLLDISHHPKFQWTPMLWNGYWNITWSWFCKKSRTRGAIILVPERDCVEWFNWLEESRITHICWGDEILWFIETPPIKDHLILSNRLTTLTGQAGCTCLALNPCTLTILTGQAGCTRLALSPWTHVYTASSNSSLPSGFDLSILNSDFESDQVLMKRQ